MSDTARTPRKAVPRSDLSPYLVHLTRPGVGVTARQNLVSIVKNGVIEARTPYGIAVTHLDYMGWADRAFKENQKVVCFSETPLANIAGLLNPGIWRRYNFQPYGVVFTRSHLLHVGANMVQYLNQYRGDGFKWSVHYYNDLIDEAVLGADGKPDLEKWNGSPIAKVTPFIESIGEWPTEYGGTKTKEFSFEREWRFAGDFRFYMHQLHGLVVPAGEVTAVQADLVAAGVRETHMERFAFVEVDGAAGSAVA
jgi:hypothetical protein